MAAEGSGQAACAHRRAVAELGGGVLMLQEVRLADGPLIRYEASNGNQSEGTLSHGQKLQELFLDRFVDQDGAIADVTTGRGSSDRIRITATEVLQQEERLVSGLVARLRGDKAVISLAATDEAYEGRGHMTYLFCKVAAGFLSRHGVSMVAVEADGGFWAQQAFGLDELIDKRGKINYDLDVSRQDAAELQSMRSAKVPLLVGPLAVASDVPLSLTAAEADARAAPRRSSSAAAAAAAGSRVGGKDCSPLAGKVEVCPPQDLVGWFNTNRATLTLYETASKAEGKAGRDLLFLVAAQACGVPPPELLCPDSSLELAEEEGMDGIAGVQTWAELQHKMRGWRRSGALRDYLQRVAGNAQEEGEQEAEGAQQPRGTKKRSRRRTKQSAAEQPQRAKKQRRAAGGGAAQQAQQGGRGRAAQPATPETQREQAVQQGSETPALEDLLAAALQHPDAAAAGLNQKLIGQYCARRLRFPPTEQEGQEKSLRTMLKLSLVTAAAELMRTAMAD